MTKKTWKTHSDKSRFENKYIPEPMSGCWIWIAGYFDVGYGTMRIGKKQMGAHRASWILTVGAIPKGFYVLHKCDNQACVNPQHLFLGTQKDNMMDMVQKNRHRSQIYKKESCKNGHLFTKENTKQTSRQRICLKCSRETKKRYKLRQWNKIRNAVNKNSGT